MNLNSGFPGANFSLTGIYFSHMLAYLLIVLLFCSPMQAGKNTMITSSRKMLLTNLTSSSWPWPNFGRNNRKRRLRNKTQIRTLMRVNLDLIHTDKCFIFINCLELLWLLFLYISPVMNKLESLAATFWIIFKMLLG